MALAALLGNKIVNFRGWDIWEPSYPFYTLEKQLEKLLPVVCSWETKCLQLAVLEEMHEYDKNTSVYWLLLAAFSKVIYKN